jgi:type IV secretory pathway VirB10-like protein
MPPQQSPEQDIQVLTNEPPKEPEPKPAEQKQKEPKQKPPKKPEQKPTEPEQKEPEIANEEAKEYKELGIGKPNVFDGNRKKVDRFLQSCMIYFAANTKVYDDDTKKIIFIPSFMKEKEVDMWAQQYIKK